LAREGTRKPATEGTNDKLQQLSLTVVTIALMHILSDAVNGDSNALNQAYFSMGAAFKLRRNVFKP
jgi:hypothetical protein